MYTKINNNYIIQVNEQKKSNDLVHRMFTELSCIMYNTYEGGLLFIITPLR